MNDETTKIIRDYYDANVETEWNRVSGRPEFIITSRMLGRYIRPGDKILDIGGGPGRYSLHLAKKGCDVTLLDLSPANAEFAETRAAEAELFIKTIVGDAREADKLTDEKYDHVLLMGPMYHLPDEESRIRAVNAAVAPLKPGGVLFVSFISSHAGMIDLMAHAPQKLASTREETEFMNLVIDDKPFSGVGFTVNYFIRQKDILPFMARFPLEKLRLFGQEGITSPCEAAIMSQSEEVYARWLYLAEMLCEREEFLSWSPHLMYVGRRI